MVLSTTWVFLPKWPISLCSDSDFLGLVRFVPLGKNTLPAMTVRTTRHDGRFSTCCDGTFLKCWWSFHTLKTTTSKISILRQIPCNYGIILWVNYECLILQFLRVIHSSFCEKPCSNVCKRTCTDFSEPLKPFIHKGFKGLSFL